MELRIGDLVTAWVTARARAQIRSLDSVLGLSALKGWRWDRSTLLFFFKWQFYVEFQFWILKLFFWYFRRVLKVYYVVLCTSLSGYYRWLIFILIYLDRYSVYCMGLFLKYSLITSDSLALGLTWLLLNKITQRFWFNKLLSLSFTLQLQLIIFVVPIIRNVFMHWLNQNSVTLSI